MKLELDMWHHLLDVYTKFQTDISKHVQKSPENFSLAGSSTNAPVSNVFVHQRAKNYQTMTKVSRNQDTHNISVYTKFEPSIWFSRPWMQINDFYQFLAVKYIKVSRLEWNSNLTCNATYCMHILNFKFISQIMKKTARKTSKNPKRAKIIAKIPKIVFSQKTDLMSRSIQQATYVLNLKNLSWFLRPWLQKMVFTYFWL